jgi:hypothetical protein
MGRAGEAALSLERRMSIMSKPHKAPPVDKATPRLKQSTKTDPDKVSATRSTTQVMQASPGWASAPDVQSSTKTWNSAADALEANAKLIADLRAQLATAEGN